MAKMKQTEIKKLKEILQNQLSELQSSFKRNIISMETSTAVPDINDQATLESERNFELRVKDRQRKLIPKFQEALDKIADGSYGICESCAEPIGVKRLLARPVTTYCINCKAEMEAEEKREESLNFTPTVSSQPEMA